MMHVADFGGKGDLLISFTNSYYDLQIDRKICSYSVKRQKMHSALQLLSPESSSNQIVVPSSQTAEC